MEETLYGGWMPDNGVPANIQAEMALAAGGLIKQSIHHDTYAPDSWDPASTTTLNVQVLNAAIFERVTGKRPPTCPISETAYQAAGKQYFDIPEASSSVSGKFGAVKSLGQLGALNSEGEGSGSAQEEIDYSVRDHMEFQLGRTAPDAGFRTVSAIEEEVRNSRVVSW
jgi:hypothetical protein